jgi:hypothetical protein
VRRLPSGGMPRPAAASPSARKRRRWWCSYAASGAECQGAPAGPLPKPVQPPLRAWLDDDRDGAPGRGEQHQPKYDHAVMSLVRVPDLVLVLAMTWVSLSSCSGNSRKCTEGCHWDCFSDGWSCVDGKVWRIARGPRRCCNVADPWPGPGPTCSTDVPVRVCGTNCSTATPRCPEFACERDPPVACPDAGRADSGPDGGS